MFQHSLKNNISTIKEYLIGFFIGVLISVVASYMYRDYKIKNAHAQIDLLSNKIDSIENEIRFKNLERAALEEQVKNKKIEIQEVTIIKYKRPPINSADSSFQYLKGLLK